MRAIIFVFNFPFYYSRIVYKYIVLQRSRINHTNICLESLVQIREFSVLTEYAVAWSFLVLKKNEFHCCRAALRRVCRPFLSFQEENFPPCHFHGMSPESHHSLSPFPASFFPSRVSKLQARPSELLESQ